jgi:hypothetical protein
MGEGWEKADDTMRLNFCWLVEGWSAEQAQKSCMPLDRGLHKR